MKERDHVPKLFVDETVGYVVTVQRVDSMRIVRGVDYVQQLKVHTEFLKALGLFKSRVSMSLACAFRDIQ